MRENFCVSSSPSGKFEHPLDEVIVSDIAAKGDRTTRGGRIRSDSRLRNPCCRDRKNACVQESVCRGLESICAAVVSILGTRIKPVYPSRQHCDVESSGISIRCMFIIRSFSLFPICPFLEWICRMSRFRYNGCTKCNCFRKIPLCPTKSCTLCIIIAQKYHILPYTSVRNVQNATVSSIRPYFRPNSCTKCIF